jgi:hypothetical protein
MRENEGVENFDSEDMLGKQIALAIISLAV